MQKISLWDLLNEKIKIRISQETRKNFFSESFKVFDNSKEISNYLEIPLRRFYKFKSGKSAIPLIFIIKIIHKFPLKVKVHFQKKIEINIEEIKFGNNPKAKPIKKPRFPMKFSLKLARISGHIIGDGGMRRTDRDMTVYYANKNKRLIAQFKNDIFDVFGDVDSKEYIYKGTKIIVLPSIVGFLLMKFIGEQQNETKHIPEIIFNSDKRIQTVFLRSLYDDEGSVSIESKCIVFKMISKSCVEGCKELLKMFSIKPGEVKFNDNNSTNRIYYFYLSSKPDLEKFRKYVNFYHSKKLKQLNKLLTNYKKKGFRQGETREQIFKQIQLNKSITVKELSRKLSIPAPAIRMHTRRLKIRGLVKTIKPQHEEIFFTSTGHEKR